MKIRPAALTGPLLAAAISSLSFLAFPGPAAGSPGNDDAVFQAKANELVAGKTARLDRIMALHAFVRDFIRQVETKFS